MMNIGDEIDKLQGYLKLKKCEAGFERQQLVITKVDLIECT